jgi:hypothetical protein
MKHQFRTLDSDYYRERENGERVNNYLFWWKLAALHYIYESADIHSEWWIAPSALSRINAEISFK